MGKWFEVKVVRVTVLAVEVEDAEGADEDIKYAISEVGEFEEADCSGEIVDPVEIDRLKRHADEILPVSA